MNRLAFTIIAAMSGARLSIGLATAGLLLVSGPMYAQRSVPSLIVRGPTQYSTHEAPIQSAPRCPRSGMRKLGQWTATVAGAGVGGLIAFNAYDDPFGPGRKVKGDAGYTPAANTAFAVGSTLGSTALGLLTAKRGPGCRPLLSVVGTAIPSLPLFLGREDPYLPIAGLLFVAPLQGLGAVIAH